MSKRNADEMAAQFPPTTVAALETGLYSDLTIKCNEKEFKVHRVVVCFQSEPMAGFMRGDSKESKTGVIDLSDDDPVIVEMMVRFFYTKTLTLPTRHSQPKIVPPALQATAPHIDTSLDLLLCTKTYIMADRFAVAALKVAAKDKYTHALPNGWNSVSFSSSLEMMFENTMEKDRMLKDVAIGFAGKRAARLKDRGEFVEMCKRNAVICFEIMVASLSFRDFKGCPWFGKLHENHVVSGKTKAFMCTNHQCRAEFDGFWDY